MEVGPNQPLMVKDAIPILNLSESSIRKLIRSGKIPHHKRGYRFYMYRKDVEAYRDQLAIQDRLFTSQTPPEPQEDRINYNSQGSLVEVHTTGSTNVTVACDYQGFCKAQRLLEGQIYSDDDIAKRIHKLQSRTLMDLRTDLRRILIKINQLLVPNPF